MAQYALLQFLPILALDGFHGEEESTVAVLCVGPLAIVDLFKKDYQKRHELAEAELTEWEKDHEDEGDDWNEMSETIEEKYQVMFCTMAIGKEPNDSARHNHNQKDLILEIVEIEYEIQLK